MVTANKELIAAHGTALADAAGAAGVDLLYEAAVAGAIPLIRPLRESLAGERIRRVMGIVNGTTNLHPDDDDGGGFSYTEALAEAQRLGFAERDPTRRCGRARRRRQGGHPGRRWPSAATSSAGDVPPAKGIAKVDPVDIAFADRLGMSSSCWPSSSDDSTSTGDDAVAPRSRCGCIRPCCPAPIRWRRCAGRSTPCSSRATAAGELMLYGRGAGGRPTASAVLGDLIDAAHHLRTGAAARTVPRVRPRDPARPTTCAAPWYLNIDVADRPGVLAAVAQVFGDNGVSIRSMEQVGLGDEARLIFLTHVAREGDVQRTLAGLRELDVVDHVGGVLRVMGDEDEGLTHAWRGRGVIEAYRDLLPVTADTPVVTLLEGGTPLLDAPRACRTGSGARVLLKLEGLNPTGSFKDRGMTLAISKAVEEGAKAVVCASTGNTSASAAAYAARAGLTCAVLIPEGHIALGQAGPGPRARGQGAAGARATSTRRSPSCAAWASRLRSPSSTR